jgi:hypothetical protein
MIFINGAVYFISAIIAGNLTINGQLITPNIVSADPHVVGEHWVNPSALDTVSAG